MKRQEVLHKFLQLNEYLKISIKQDKNHHHPLKNDLGKSSRRILWVLNKEGNLNQRNISKKLNISPQAVSEAVKKLDNEDLITKDLSNKNETILYLTKKGKESVKAFEVLFENHANKLFEDFNDEELQSVIDFITKLTKEKKND